MTWLHNHNVFDWILLWFTIPALLYIAYLQLQNWRKYRDGNGADAQRIAMAFGSIAAVGTCVGVLMRNFDVVTVFVSIVPFVGMTLYALKRK